MRKLSMLALFLISISLLLLIGCKEKSITGEGPTTETMRDVSSFTKLEINGNYQIIVEIGEKQSIRMIAQANIIPYILTEVDDDTLSITPDDDVKLSYKEIPSIAITVQQLTDISMSGSSKLTVSKLNNKTLTITSKGNHQVIFSGKTDELIINSSGANEIHAENLQATNTKININGSSTVFTTTTDTLDAKIQGYGKIGYTGTPKNITQEIHGSGVIKRVQ